MKIEQVVLLRRGDEVVVRLRDCLGHTVYCEPEDYLEAWAKERPGRAVDGRITEKENGCWVGEISLRDEHGLVVTMSDQAYTPSIVRRSLPLMVLRKVLAE